MDNTNDFELTEITNELPKRHSLVDALGKLDLAIEKLNSCPEDHVDRGRDFIHEAYAIIYGQIALLNEVSAKIGQIGFDASQAISESVGLDEDDLEDDEI